MKLNAKTLDWLLEENNPPVRKRTLVNLLAKSTNSHEVKTASAQANHYPPIQDILSHWEELWTKHRKYPPYKKYEGGYWNFIFLGELGADGKDKRIQAAVDYLFQISTTKTLFAWDGKSERFGICLSANILRSMCKMGFDRDKRVLTGIESLAREIVAHQGAHCEVMDYSALPDCFMALPQTLTALTSVPPKARTNIVQEAIDRIAFRLLERDVFVYVPKNSQEWREHSWKISRGVERGNVLKTIREEKTRWLAEKGIDEYVEKDSWKSFGYPLHYNPDLLEAMLGLAAAGVKDCPQTEKALDVIESKADTDGRWKMARSLNGKMLVDIEKKGKPSKWVTLRALEALKHFGKLQ